MKQLTTRAKNLIFKFDLSHEYIMTEKKGMTFTFILRFLE